MDSLRVFTRGKFFQIRFRVLPKIPIRQYSSAASSITMPSDIREYDFIIVGAGPAGSSVARGLANSSSKPTVGLLEAGGIVSDDLKMMGNIFVQHLNPTQIHPYKSAPQEHLGGRIINLARGSGLGGTTNINFTAWNVGPRDDWDELARKTGDRTWEWENAKQRFSALETYHLEPNEVPQGVKKYLNPKKEDHGHNGPLHITYQTEWDTYTKHILDSWEANGYNINPDVGSGNPLGISVAPKTAWNGTRVTAEELLHPTPTNLHIRLNSPTHKVLFEGDKAVGVALLDGTILKAKKEVILSAGSLDTPKILMHSGIGPADQLNKYGIPILRENKEVGQNYRDHYHCPLKFARSDENDRIAAFFRDPVRRVEAKREWQIFRTGEFANYGTTLNIGFFKSKGILESKEFRDLPAEEQERINRPTVPSYEISAGGVVPEYYSKADSVPVLLGVNVFVYNTQGLGTAELASSDPTVPLTFNPAFVKHPFDKRTIIEATRETLKVTSSAAFKKGAHPELKNEFSVPASDSEEDILAYWRANTASTFHMSGTTQIGREGDAKAVVDPQLRVIGLKSLRVADLGIMPFMPGSHPQASAYQIGMVMAEKLIAEHGLDELNSRL